MSHPLLAFLASPFFKYAVFPLGGVFLGVWIHYVTRNDKFATFRKEDLAVGLDLFMAANLLFLIYTTDNASALVRTNADLRRATSSVPHDAARIAVLQPIQEDLSTRLVLAGWVVAILFLGLWGLSTVVRKWGWKSETEMDTLIGIALPLAVGVLSLIAVMAGLTR